MQSSKNQPSTNQNNESGAPSPGGTSTPVTPKAPTATSTGPKATSAAPTPKSTVATGENLKRSIEISQQVVSKPSTSTEISNKSTGAPPSSTDGHNYINILLLGETGVGKSTFVNAFVNYISYGNFDVALNSKPLCIIPTQFTMYTHTNEEVKVKIGQDKNEFTDTVGASATQGTKAYVFPLGDGTHHLRIIDTPGMGDTRDIEKDKENFENILEFLSRFDSLHAICILLKPNNSRLTVLFEYCVKQLLCRLEKSAANNIIFIFTNSRTTFYRPGETKPILQELLNKIKNKPPHISIKFDMTNTFCLDNEAYRFLIACKNGIEFTDTEIKEFAGSWARSVEVCVQLITYIIGNEEAQPLLPHKVQDTVSVNDARRVIFLLSRPLADITSLIQINKQKLNNQKKKVEDCKKYQTDLKGQLYLPCIKLKEIELDQPVTVCTSNKCATVVTVDNQQLREYNQRCHNPCYLKNVPKEIIGAPQLFECQAMDTSGRCTQCGCGFQVHMHVYYMTERYEDTIEDRSIRDQLDKCTTDQEKYENYMKIVEKQITELDYEHTIITKNLAKFAHFIKMSTILPFNDAIKQYIEYLIVREEQLGPDGNKDLIKHYREMLKRYEEEKKLLEDAMSLTADGAVISGVIKSQDIMAIVKDLFNLKHNGKQLKSLYEKQKKGSQIEHHKNEEYIYNNTDYSPFLSQNRRNVQVGGVSGSQIPWRCSDVTDGKSGNKKKDKTVFEKVTGWLKGRQNEPNVPLTMFHEEFYIPKELIEVAYGKQGENIQRVYDIEGVHKLHIDDKTGFVKISGITRESVELARVILDIKTEILNLVGKSFSNKNEETSKYFEDIKKQSELITIQQGTPFDDILPVVCIGRAESITTAKAFLEPFLYKNQRQSQERNSTSKKSNFDEDSFEKIDLESNDIFKSKLQEAKREAELNKTHTEVVLMPREFICKLLEDNSEKIDNILEVSGINSLTISECEPSNMNYIRLQYVGSPEKIDTAKITVDFLEKSLKNTKAKIIQSKIPSCTFGNEKDTTSKNEVFNRKAITSNYTNKSRQLTFAEILENLIATTNFEEYSKITSETFGLSLPRSFVIKLLENNSDILQNLIEKSDIQEVEVMGDQGCKFPMINVILKGNPANVSKAKTLLEILEKSEEFNWGICFNDVDVKTTKVTLREILNTKAQEGEGNKFQENGSGKSTTIRKLEPSGAFYQLLQQSNLVAVAKAMPGITDVTSDSESFIIEGSDETAVKKAYFFLELKQEKVAIPLSVYKKILDNSDILTAIKLKTDVVDLKVTGPKSMTTEEKVLFQSLETLLAKAEPNELEKIKEPKVCLSLPRGIVLKFLKNNQCIIQTLADVSCVDEIKIIGDNGEQFPVVNLIVQGDPEGVSKARYLLEHLEKSNFANNIKENGCEDLSIIPTCNIFGRKPEEKEASVCIIGNMDSIREAKKCFAEMFNVSD